MTFVEAARAMIKADGKLPIKATFLIEGEEESGSPSLVPFLKANKKELSCDAAFVCDSNMWDAKTPAITTRLRGLAHEEVTVTGPSIDLHSGMFGGPAMNPIRALTKMIAATPRQEGQGHDSRILRRRVGACRPRSRSSGVPQVLGKEIPRRCRPEDRRRRKGQQRSRTNLGAAHG